MSQVTIVHTFDKDVKAHVIESWLHYYLDFGELKKLIIALNPPSSSSSSSLSSTPSSSRHSLSLLRRVFNNVNLPSILPVRPCASSGGGGGRGRGGSSNKSHRSMSTSASTTNKNKGTTTTTTTSTPSTTSSTTTPSNHAHQPYITYQETNDNTGITMADLGRSDSLERLPVTLDLFEGDLLTMSPSSTPEGQEIAQQLPFLEAFRESARRCDGFFVAESERLIKEYNEALKQLKAAEHALTSISKHKKSLSKFHATKIWADIKAVYKNLHREIKDLRSFSRTNFDLAIRLVGLYRRAVGRSSRVASGMWQHLRKLEFTNDKRLHDLTLELERQYADAFTFGFVPFAHKELYAPLKGEWHVFRVGLRFGVTLILLFWVLWNALWDDSQGIDLFEYPIIHVYAAIGGGILLIWTWGLNLVVWERAGVNYTDIFQFQSPITSVTDVFNGISLATCLYLSNLLLYYKSLRGVAGPLQALPSHLLPVLMITYTIYKLFFPWTHRKEMFGIIGQIVIAPLGEVGFKELFFADTLTSFNKVSYEAVLGGCYLFRGGFVADHSHAPTAGGGGAGITTTSSNAHACGPTSVAQKYIAPLVIAFPLWLRLLQCLKRYYLTSTRFPPMYNSLKYGISMSVVLFAVFNPEYSRGVLNTHTGTDTDTFTAYEFFWLLSQIATTLGTWLWDVMVDWGLFQNKKGLRSHLLFRRHVWVYYTAIVLDLVLRFLWTVSLLPEATSGFVHDFQLRMRFFIPPLELFRRSVWSWLRLEREQSIRDVQEGMLDDVMRQKRASKNKAERTRRLEEIANEVTRLCKAVQLIKRQPSSTKKNGAAAGGLKLVTPTSTRGGVASVAGEGGNNKERSPSTSGSSTAFGNWDEDDEPELTNSELDLEEDEEEDEINAMMEAQRNLQKDLVSHRSVMIEVGVVFVTFVGLAVWASGDH